MGVTLFFLQKILPFLVIASESDDFFSCRLLATSIFPRRLSSVLPKFRHKKNNFISGVTPGGCHPGGSPPAHP